MSLLNHYVRLARTANHLAILTGREHWRRARAHWLALAMQEKERGSAQVWAMVAAVVLLGAPALILDQQAADPLQRVELVEPLPVPPTYDEPQE